MLDEVLYHKSIDNSNTCNIRNFMFFNNKMLQYIALVILIILFIGMPILLFVKDKYVLHNSGCPVSLQAECTKLGSVGACVSTGKCCECDDFEESGCVPKNCTNSACQGPAKCS